MSELINLHIDGSKGTVGDGAADGTGEGEAADQVNALGAFGGRGGSSRHCDG
jgi:hypothetical protein